MTPADQILADGQELKTQIEKLINDFERRTGAVVARVELVSFERAHRHSRDEVLNVRIDFELPRKADALGS